MIHYTLCPICASNAIAYSFAATDHTVSKKTFEVWKCVNCTGLFTQDVPGQEEIGAYYQSNDYISHSDAEGGIINNLYHRVRSFTLGQKKSLLENETGIAAGSVLDVGCGTGAFLHKMRSGGWQAIGLEPDAGAREKARQLYQMQVFPSEELFALPPDSIDAITLWHVLEHVHELHRYVAQIKNLLKPYGRLFIAVPNHTSADAGKYQAGWAAFDVPRHLYHFSPYSMNILLNQHGLQIKKIKPMWFDSFYVSMLSEQNAGEGGNLFNAVLTGLKSNFQAVSNKEKASSLIYIIGKN